MSKGWHPKDTENELDLLRSELDSCKAEIERLRRLNTSLNGEVSTLQRANVEAHLETLNAWKRSKKERAGDPRFHAVLELIADLHDKKQADYGKSGDPFANVRASEDFGIAGWVGCMMRANDKMRRLQQAALGQTLKNESIEDSLMDLAVYSIIGLVLFQETAGGLSTKEQPPCPESEPSTPVSSTPSTGMTVPTSVGFKWEPPLPKQ